MWSWTFNETRTSKRESRLKRRNLYASVFPENVGVKENRKILLCKTSGGDAEIREEDQDEARSRERPSALVR